MRCHVVTDMEWGILVEISFSQNIMNNVVGENCEGRNTHTHTLVLPVN